MSILVVMNDDVDGRLAAYLLTQVDPDVVRVATLDEARHQLAYSSWAGVILDTQLPDGSAFDLLSALADMGYDGAVVVLSAAKEVALKVRTLEEGADDYIVRPYEPAELLARVKATMRRSRRRVGTDTSAVVQVGPVRLDVNELEVALPGNRREHLTPNEMRLLHYLMLRAGQVVEQHELETRLFRSEGQTSGSNAVGVYMRRVRRKVESDPDRPRYIVTIRGRGYRFQAENEHESPLMGIAPRNRDHAVDC